MFFFGVVGSGSLNIIITSKDLKWWDHPRQGAVHVYHHFGAHMFFFLNFFVAGPQPQMVVCFN